GIGIEHRDHDRHIRAADRNNEQEAERERDERDEPEERRHLRRVEENNQEHERHAEAAIDEVALRQKDRRARHPSVELQESDDRAREGHGANREPERHLDNATGVDGAALFDAEGFGRIKRSGGDQYGRQADQRMEHRHQWGHRRHLHGARAPCADAAADGDAKNDEKPGERARRRTNCERRQDRDAHADHAKAVALARGRWRREAAQRENEQNAGDEVEQGREIGVHRRQPFFLYIASMRSVTRKPPKMFIDARISATNPTKRANPDPLSTAATPIDSNAPTTMTEEMALVSDMSGVRKAGVTDQTT